MRGITELPEQQKGRWEMLEKLIRNKTIYAAASIVIGVVMIIKGGQVADDIVRIIGWLLVGTGAAYAASYFFGEDQDPVQLGYAIAAAAGGLLTVLLARTIIGVIPIALGALLILNGITNLGGANGASGSPAYSRGLAIAVIVLGVLVIIFGKTLINAAVLIIGICLVLNGLAELNLIRQIR